MFRDPYSYLTEFTGALALAGAGTGTVVANIDREADFAIYQIRALATSFNAILSLRDQENRLIIDDNVPLTNMAGLGPWPMILDRERIIKRTGQIRASLTDVSGAGNTIRLLFTGAQLFPSAPFVVPAFRWAEPYSVKVTFGNASTDDAAIVGANATAEFSRRLPGDSYYEISRVAVSRQGTCTVQILTNAFREWFRSPVHADLMGASDFSGQIVNGAGVALGPGVFPIAPWAFRFDPPKLVPINSALTVRIADLSGAPNRVALTFHGVRKYL